MLRITESEKRKNELTKDIAELKREKSSWAEKNKGLEAEIKKL